MPNIEKNILFLHFFYFFFTIFEDRLLNNFVRILANVSVFVYDVIICRYITANLDCFWYLFMINCRSI